MLKAPTKYLASKILKKKVLKFDLMAIFTSLNMQQIGLLFNDTGSVKTIPGKRNLAQTMSYPLKLTRSENFSCSFFTLFYTVAISVSQKGKNNGGNFDHFKYRTWRLYFFLKKGTYTASLKLVKIFRRIVSIAKIMFENKEKNTRHVG